MFFTPGRILGMLAFVVVMLAAGAALKWLDGKIGYQALPADDGLSAPSPAEKPGPTPPRKRYKRARRN